MSMTRQVTGEKKIFPDPKNSFPCITKSCHYSKSQRKHWLNGSCRPPAGTVPTFAQTINAAEKELKLPLRSPSQTKNKTKRNEKLFRNWIPASLVPRMPKNAIRPKQLLHDYLHTNPPARLFQPSLPQTPVNCRFWRTLWFPAFWF